MTAYRYQDPVYRVRCDTPGCPSWFESPREFVQRHPHNTVQDAGRYGWDVPPARGKGSRRKTHYCPACVEDRDQEKGGQR